MLDFANARALRVRNQLAQVAPVSEHRILRQRALDSQVLQVKVESRIESHSPANLREGDA